MTDKVQKIREKVEKLKSNLLYGACSSQVAMEARCKEEAYNDVLGILDTMQGMTDKDKQILIADLCARLPYGVKVAFEEDGELITDTITMIGWPSNEFMLYEASEFFTIEEIKPYLRPMSSMTEEELKEFKRLKQMSVTVVMPNGVSLLKPTYIVDLEEDGDGLNHLYDWLNAHHFDFRKTSDGKTMIEAGLALEAPKDMYLLSK